MLLQLKMSLNEQLLESCESGNLDFVNKLIEQGAGEFEWGIVRASKGGHLSIVNKLIDLGTETNWALINACSYGHLHIVDKLLSLDTYSTKCLEWCLFEACRNGHMYISEILVKLGAPFEDDNWGKKDYENYLYTKNILIEFLGLDITSLIIGKL